jgi:PAS domain S-box-containing protein
MRILIRHNDNSLDRSQNEFLEKLRVSEERLKFAMESSEHGVWDWNVKTNEVFFSKRFKEMLGYDEHEILNVFEEWKKRIHPDDLERVLAELEKYLNSIISFYEVEHRMLCKDGTYKWILARGKVVNQSENGEILRVIGTQMDLTNWIETRKMLEDQKYIIENQKEILEEERNNFKIYFDSNPIGIIVVDREAVVVQANPAFSRMINKNIEEVPGKKVGDCFNCKNSIENGCAKGVCENCNIKRSIQSVLDTGDPIYNCEIHYSLMIDGKVRELWYKMNFVSISMHGERQVMIAIDDITKKKCLEISLGESSNFYLSMFDNFPALVWRADKKLKGNYFNKKWLEFTGKSLQEELELNWKDKIHPDDIENCRKVWLSKSKLFEPLEMEYRLRRHDGEYRWILDRRGPIYDMERKHIGFIGVANDVTEKKIASEGLDRYKILLDNIRDIILFFDLSGNIIDANKTAVRTYGYTLNEFKSMNIYDLREKESIIAEQFEQAKQESISFETVHIKKDGSRFPVEVSAQQTLVGNKRLILSIVRDITERKKVEKNIKEAKNDAETANKVKSEFLANMSHEIRTPINGMMGMIDLTLLSDMSFEQRDNLIIAKSCANSLLAIINDILDFSKLEASKLTIENIDFDLKAILEEVLKIHIPRANSKGIELYYTLSSNIPSFLVGDPNRLKQIINNLVGNAIKFTESGEVILYVKKSGQIENVIELNFEVSDTGIGISEEDIPKLFKPFNQLENSYSRKSGGTGLGLAISKQLVEMMGGQIGVKSVKGSGSSFYFTAKFEIGEKPFNKTMQPLQINRTSKPLNILLVEDDEVNRIVLFRMLKEKGHIVEMVQNGIEALAIHSQKQFDIILMDIQMPVMNGIETTKQIRKREGAHRHTPIIALTAYALIGDREHYISMGMDEYISKPIKMDELFSVIEKMSM